MSAPRTFRQRHHKCTDHCRSITPEPTSGTPQVLRDDHLFDAGGVPSTARGSFQDLALVLAIPPCEFVDVDPEVVQRREDGGRDLGGPVSSS
jgi:hypothetical protein